MALNQAFCSISLGGIFSISAVRRRPLSFGLLHPIWREIDANQHGSIEK
jgi:hypothetical protein